MDAKFISNGFIHEREIELTRENGINTFDNPKQNPNSEYKFLIQVGGGYQAFRTKREAKEYYNQDWFEIKMV